MPDVGEQLKQTFDRISADPKFIDLSYQDQYVARAQIAGKILMQDPVFAGLPDMDKRMNLETIARQPPALADKGLESYVKTTVGAAKKGDPQALALVTGLSDANAMGRTSILGSLAGKFYGAVNPAATEPGGATPYGTLSGKQIQTLMDGSDASKLSTYFGELAARDPLFSKSSMKKYANAATLIGSTVDFSSLLIVPGGAAAEGADAAAKGASLTSRAMMNAGKLVLPALTNMAVGAVANVARTNAIATLQKDPGMYTDTMNKLVSTAGEGAAFNFLFGLGVGATAEYAIPAVKALIRGPTLDKSLASTGALWWKRAADPLEVDKAIQAAGGTGSIPVEVVQTLHPYVRDTSWLRNYTMEAASRDAATADLRPLDRAVLASVDMPDVRFAPRDWAKPTEGPYTVWEMTAEKGASERLPKYLQSGEAANLGDLQSKLADKLAARYDGINDLAKPQSMQLSQTLIAQGKLQAENAKAYDPFPETVSAGFTRPSLRGYLSPTEAQDAAYAATANGGQAIHVKIAATEDMMKRIEANKSFLVDGAPLKLTAVNPEDANAIAIITKPASPEAIVASQDFVNRALKADAGWTEATARKHYLVQQGFDGIVDSASGDVETFFPSRMKWITDQVDASTGKLQTSTASRLASSGPLGSKIAIQAKIESSIGKESLAGNSQVLANVAMSKFKGNLDARDVENFVSQLMDAKGIPRNEVQVRKISGASDSLGGKVAAEFRQTSEDYHVVNVPERITSFGAQKAFVNDLLSGIDKLGEGAKPAGGKYQALANAKTAKSMNTAPSRFVLPFDTEEANHTWLQSVAQGEYSGSNLTRLSDGSYALQDAASKVQQSFKDIYEARDAMLMATLDDRFIRGDLYRQGYKLTGKKGEPYTLSGPGLPKPISGADLPTLLKQIDYKPSTISNRLAPRDVQITPDKTIATFDGKAMIASKSDIAKTLSKFENPDELASMVHVQKAANGDVFKIAENHFRVDVPSLAATRYFSSIEEAKAFINSDMKSMKNLKDAAGRKGLSLYDDHNTGGFLVGDGEKVMQAKNKDEALKIMKGYPDAPGAREILSALDPQADAAVKAVMDKLDPELLKAWRGSNFDRSTVRWDGGAIEESPLPTSRGTAKPGVKASIRAWSSSYDRYTEATVNRELGLKELGNMRNQLGRSSRAYNTQTSADEALHAAIFTDEHGRPMKVERKEAIAAYKEAQGVPESLPIVKDKYGDLTPHEQQVLGKLNTLTDKYMTRYGVDSSTYVKGYMSHVRKYALSNWDTVGNLSSADDLLEQAYKGMDNVPKGLKAFFHNERAESLLNASMESDPEKILNRYVQAGNKELYLKQPLQDTLDYLKTNGKNLPGDVVAHTLYDMRAMAGHHEIVGMSQAEDTLEAIHAAFAKVPVLGKLIKPTVPGTGAKMFQNFMSMTYLGNVGFRPWLAVRNMLQPYNMLAPRIGLGPVLEAQRQILGPQGKEIMLRMRAQGTLSGDVPVAANLGASKMAQITKKSMSMTFVSDDITRGTAALAAENMLDEGIRSWKAGKFKGDIQKFKDYTEIRAIQAGNPALADQVAQLALSGDPQKILQAKVLFGQKLAFETQPDYSRYAQPHVLTNTLPGYVFGRYGTYSVAYRENIYRGWQAAQGFANKSLFAARFIGIGAGIAAGLGAMGIEGKDFEPGYGGLFGGGPQFQEALTAIESFSGNAKGSQARAAFEKTFSPVIFNEKDSSLKLNYPAILPGSLQAMYAKRAADALAHDDLWGAFLAASTVPVLK